MTIEKNDQWPISIDPFFKKATSGAYATCSYFSMGERNCFYDIKIPVWGITDDGVQMAEQSATPHLKR